MALLDVVCIGIFHYYDNPAGQCRVQKAGEVESSRFFCEKGRKTRGYGILGHGVMVTLQFLELSFWVRIPVSQRIFVIKILRCL